MEGKTVYKLNVLILDEYGNEKTKTLYRDKNKEKIEQYIEQHEQELTDAGYYAIYIEH